MQSSLRKMISVLKGKGKISLAPVILIYIIIPILESILMQWLFDLETAVYRTAMIFVPLGSIIWIIIVFKPYVEDDGNEIYYLFNRSKWKEVFLLGILYVMLIIPMYLAYYFMLGDLYGLMLLIQLCVLSFAFGASVYFFIYLFRSVYAAYIIMLLYTFYSTAPYLSVKMMTEGQKLVLNYTEISLYYPDTGFLMDLLPYCVITIVLYLLGIALNDFYEKYN